MIDSKTIIIFFASYNMISQRNTQQNTAAISCWVVFISSLLGSAIPEGWLCANSKLCEGAVTE